MAALSKARQIALQADESGVESLLPLSAAGSFTILLSYDLA